MKALFPPLALFILIPLSAVSAADFADIDARFEAVNGLLAQADAPAGSPFSRAQRKFQKKCSSGFSIEGVVGDKDFHDPNMKGVIEDVRRYYACEAFTRRDPSFFCKKLNSHWPLPPQRRLEDNCIDQYNLYTVAQLNITGNPDAVKICRTLALSAHYLDGPFGGATIEEECDLQTAKPAPGCKDMTDVGQKPLSDPLGTATENCLEANMLHGQGNVCHLIKDSAIRNLSEEWCLDIVAYRKAYEEGDIGLCGDSLACRMLMGRKDVCGGHLDKLRGEYCRFSARRKLKAEAGEMLAQAGALLDGFTPKSDPGYASRRGAYGALREKLEAPGQR